MALDLAVNPEACRLKDFRGKIQGDADILLAPDISAGNILGKSLIQLGGWKGGGVVVGAGRPIILLSRSDNASEKSPEPAPKSSAVPRSTPEFVTISVIARNRAG